jgi:beta-galactosidase
VNNAPYNIAYTVDAMGQVSVDIAYEPREAPRPESARDGEAAARGDQPRGDGRGRGRGRGRGQQQGVPNLGRFGTLWQLAAQFDHMAWYGRGPEPTYSDRKQAPLGIYSGKVADQYVGYFRPQENSNKVDVRWVAVTNGTGIGLLATAPMRIDESGDPAGALSVDARHYSTDQLEAADYDFQLSPERKTYLNLDHVQMGVGGNDSWGAPPMPAYLLPNREYKYSFSIRGIDQPPSALD